MVVVLVPPFSLVQFPSPPPAPPTIAVASCVHVRGEVVEGIHVHCAKIKRCDGGQHDYKQRAILRHL